VYVVGPDKKAVMRQVTVGVTEGNDVEVTSNLAGGDMVVTDGQDKLQEGSVVDVRSPNGQGAPGGGGAGGGGRKGGRPKA
jgi:hypothetical protein